MNDALKPQDEELLDLAGPHSPQSLGTYLKAPRAFDSVQHRAESATWVARWIVGTFAVTIALVLTGVAVAIVVSRSPDDTRRFSDTLIAVLEGLGKFLTAVFGPLLAFILGFYFSEKQKER